MNSFLSESEINNIGFKSIGKDVFISKKASIYGAQSMKIGDHVRIDDFCILSGRITLNNYIHIAAYSALYGGDEGIIIDDFANISSRVTIYSISDDYSGETMTNPMIPEEYKSVKSASVKIDRHVIIASTCVVLPGVHLYEGSAFGAFSLINHDSEPFSINVGIPFHKIKERSRNLLNLEKQFVRSFSRREVER